MTCTLLDIHWTAGFIEGDGTIVFNGRSLRMAATQAEKMPLEKLQSLWGGTIAPKQRNIGTKPLQSWALGVEVGVGLMIMMYDLMSIPRQQQICKVLAQWKINGAKSGETHYRSKLTDSEALEVMRRVDNGESMLSVAASVGVSHAIISRWFSGLSRQNLIHRLRGEKGNVNLRTQGASSPIFVTKSHSGDKFLQNLHWTAGFLEAEGCFVSTSKVITLQGIQAEMSPLEKLQKLWGGAIYPTNRGVNKPIFVWKLDGKHAAALMMTLYPLMSPGRQKQMYPTLYRWRHRGAESGEHHCGVTVNNDLALQAMRRVRDGGDLPVIAQEIDITRHELSMWMRGKNRPELLRQLESEGKPSSFVYNGGRRVPRYLNDDVIFAGMLRVRSGEKMSIVAKDLDVGPSMVSLWMAGKNRPYLLARLNAEESSLKEG